MENINSILERENIEREMEEILRSFESKCNDITYKKGIYIYGSPGCGKTEFVQRILTRLNYDIVKYDAGYVRNKSLIDTITSNNISNQNVLQMMKRTPKKIVIVMDEIDGMNNGDKGGITSLIKIIRQKKTKKQKLENKTLLPIICIGNYYIDKKIRELMKVCHIFELKTPSPYQISCLMTNTNAIIEGGKGEGDNRNKNGRMKETILRYIEGDLRKMVAIEKMFSRNPHVITEEIVETIFHKKLYNEDAKKITSILLQEPKKIEEHSRFMNETERTIVALLWHENIVDVIAPFPISRSFPFYQSILENMTYADYIDRITFQNQIWSFNEMSSLMKTFYNNKLYHDTFRCSPLFTISPATAIKEIKEKEGKGKGYTKKKEVIVAPSTISTTPTEIRFTKVLTKYSTEYNNMVFIGNLCQELDMDKRDLLTMFQELRLKFRKNTADIEKGFENYNVNRLDIRRMYRFLDKNMKPEVEEIDGGSSSGEEVE